MAHNTRSASTSAKRSDDRPGPKAGTTRAQQKEREKIKVNLEREKLEKQMAKNAARLAVLSAEAAVDESDHGEASQDHEGGGASLSYDDEDDTTSDQFKSFDASGTNAPSTNVDLSVDLSVDPALPSNTTTQEPQPSLPQPSQQQPSQQPPPQQPPQQQQPPSFAQVVGGGSPTTTRAFRTNLALRTECGCDHDAPYLPLSASKFAGKDQNFAVLQPGWSVMTLDSAYVNAKDAMGNGSQASLLRILRSSEEIIFYIRKTAKTVVLFKNVNGCMNLNVVPKIRELRDDFVPANPAAGGAADDGDDDDDDLTFIVQHDGIKYAPVGAIHMRTSKIQPSTLKIQKSDFEGSELSKEESILVMPEHLIVNDLSGAYLNCQFGMSVSDRANLAVALTKAFNVYAIVQGFGILIKPRGTPIDATFLRGLMCPRASPQFSPQIASAVLCHHRAAMLYTAPTGAKASNPHTIYRQNEEKPRNTRLVVTPTGSKSSIMSSKKMKALLEECCAKPVTKNFTELTVIEVEPSSSLADGSAHVLKKYSCIVSPLNMSDDLLPDANADANTFIISTSWAKQRDVAVAQAST